MNSFINRLVKIENAVQISQQGNGSSLEPEDKVRFDELSQRKHDLSIVGDTLNPREFAEWRHLFHKMIRNANITKQDCQGFASRLQAARSRRELEKGAVSHGC